MNNKQGKRLSLRVVLMRLLLSSKTVQWREEQSQGGHLLLVLVGLLLLKDLTLQI